MPKNKGKGGKNRRRGKNENEDTKRELVTKEEHQSYARVERILGNGRCVAVDFEDGKRRLSHIRGKLRKKTWILQGDVILIAKRAFQDDKADVIHKYTNDEVSHLKSLKEIPEHIALETEDATPDNITFDAMALSESESEDEKSQKETHIVHAYGKGSSMEIPLANPNRAQLPLEDEDDEDEDQEGPQIPAPESSEDEPEPAPNMNREHNLFGGLAPPKKIQEKTKSGRKLTEREARRGGKQRDAGGDDEFDAIARI